MEGESRRRRRRDRHGGVRELVEDADVRRIADFVVRDGRVLSFALRPAGYEPGLA
ncbi:MAG: hypothetical protein QOC64_613 [Solirubrobacteraceae bacterium]|nr:hypothetical protein [Solirubrobacteraceae bacterium]